MGNEPFAVLLGDDIVYSEKPCLEQLMDVFNQNDELVAHFKGTVYRSDKVWD